jgi:hypothetical protein
MFLQLLTLIPFAVLILVPILQRTGMGTVAWQGLVSQVSVWAMLPLALIWGVVCLDSGNSLQAAACLLSGLVILLVGQSGGWETLVSGRLTQFALGGVTLTLATGVDGLQGLLLVACLGILTFLYDGLLDLVGVTPSYEDIEEWELPRGGISELGESVVPRSQPKLRKRPPLPQNPIPPAPPTLDRPPLPGLGQVMEWTADQAERAARDAQQTQQEQKQVQQQQQAPPQSPPLSFDGRA